MRKAWVVPALGLALLLVLLLLHERPARGVGEGPRGEEGGGIARAPRSASPATAGNPDESASPDAGGGSDTTAPATGRADGRLVYRDGTPAAGITLHLAVCRSVEARRFRKDEYTDLTVQLVTSHVSTGTKTDGSFAFTFTPAPEPAGARRFVFTEPDSPAFVVEELFGNGQTVVAARRVPVTGRLTGKDGEPLPDLWFEAQLGKPEDWHTRVLKEEDVFVTATGDLHVDTLAKSDARSKTDGSFKLLLAEGRNTFTFGEAKTHGTAVVEVPPRAFDVGELRVPGPPPRGGGHTIEGRVLNLTGGPNPDCVVRAWDESVGLHTHETFTSEDGSFVIDELTGSFVILWATSTERRHIYLPTQTSGTLRPPCGPVTLQAPEAKEYAWARFPAQGFYLFLRDRVFLGGEALGPTDVVGLPPGPLKILLLGTDARILEASITVREAGDLVLGLDKFH